MRLFQIGTLVILIAAAISCKKDNGASAISTPVATPPDSVATTPDSVVTLNDSLMVAVGASKSYDADGDSIADFRISCSRFYNQTRQTQNWRIMSLNSQTIVHALPDSVDICAEPDSSVGGYTGVWHRVCRGLGALNERKKFNAVVNLELNELPNIQVNNTGKDTLLLHYSDWKQGMPYPNYIFIDYRYGFFSSGGSNYFCVSVKGKRYAYRLRSQFPWLMVVERRRLD